MRHTKYITTTFSEEVNLSNFTEQPISSWCVSHVSQEYYILHNITQECVTDLNSKRLQKLVTFCNDMYINQ